MALETMRDVKRIGSEKILNHVDTPLHTKEDAKDAFIRVERKPNIIEFKIQDGPIKENGVNGCQVTDMIAVAKHIIEELNIKFPCRENAMTITKLDEALMWQEKRTKDRENRNVEGTSRK